MIDEISRTAATDSSAESTKISPASPIANARGKVVVVDPSIVSPNGHNFDYANVFIQAARRHGRKSIILTNRRFRGEVSGCRARPVFERTIYEHGDIVAARGRPRWLAAVRAISAARRRVNQLFQARVDRLRYTGRELEADWLSLASSLTTALVTLGGGTLALVIRIAMRSASPFNRDDFAISLAREIENNRLGVGDTIIFHTASFGMLESLSETRLRLKRGKASQAVAHFIFHMSPTAPDARTYLNRYYQFSSPSNIGARLKAGSPFERIYLWATNEALVEELEALTGLQFSLWIDVTDNSEDETRRLIAAAEDVRRNPERITLGVRASDLRPEHIDPIIEALNGDINAGPALTLRVLARGSSLTGAAAQLAGRVRSLEVKDVSADNEFLVGISECDLFLTPYPVAPYAKRISAVLGDCAMLAVPVVAPAGTTLATSQAFAEVFVYPDDAGLATTLQAAIASVAKAKVAGRPIQVRPAVSAYFRDVLEDFAGREARAAAIDTKLECKVAAVVCPLWGRCGSTREFDLQFKILNDLGYLTIQIFLQRERNNSISDVPRFFQMLNENSISGRANVQRIALRGFISNISVLFNRSMYSRSAMGQLSLLHSCAYLDDAIARRWLRNAEVCIVNHCYHMEFAQRKIGGATILDTHDVQSTHLARQCVQNLVTHRVENFEVFFNDEARLVKSAGAIVNVSQSDDLIFRQINPKSIQIYPWVPPIRLVRGFPTVEAWAKAHRPEHDWYNGIIQFDLFIGGDSHPANMESTSWFMDEVYLPYLQSKSLRLAVTGRMSDALYQKYGAIEHVFYMSFVDNVDDIRALSQIAILPDRVGAGISNKAIETFSRGMAFSTTPFSIRGIKENYAGVIPAFTDPAAMAKDIIELAKGGVKLRRRQALAKEIYEQAFPYDDIQSRWSTVISQALGREVTSINQ
jgi:hypothetical protein